MTRKTLPVLLFLAALAAPAPAGEPTDATKALMANRSGEARKKALERYGGSAQSEAAVEAALAWLARHQEADGSWEPKKWDADSSRQVRTGVTGLAVLVFLGAGYTEKNGKYADKVARALKWLVVQQKPDGGICDGARAREEGVGYNHAIAALALAEAHAMTGNEACGAAAQKAVDYSIKVHQCPYSGWRYKPRESADTSVTGWYTMHLRVAKAAGLKVDGMGFQGAVSFVDVVSTKDGQCRYQPGTLPSSSMTAVGMVCRLFMGTPNTDARIAKGAEHLLKELPDWNRAEVQAGGGSADLGYYYWYQGSLAMFQMGGEGWKKWNAAVQAALLKNQRQGGAKDGSLVDTDGSWDPRKSTADKTGGRVYTTAVAALTLETCYRYAPLSPEDGGAK